MFKNNLPQNVKIVYSTVNNRHVQNLFDQIRVVIPKSASLCSLWYGNFVLYRTLQFAKVYSIIFFRWCSMVNCWSPPIGWATWSRLVLYSGSAAETTAGQCRTYPWPAGPDWPWFPKADAGLSHTHSPLIIVHCFNLWFYTHYKDETGSGLRN